MTEEGKPRKKRRIVLKIFLVLLALAVLLVAGGYTYWAVRGSRVDLPYGLKAGMSLEEIRGRGAVPFRDTVAAYEYYKDYE